MPQVAVPTGRRLKPTLTYRNISGVHRDYEVVAAPTSVSENLNTAEVESERVSKGGIAALVVARSSHSDTYDAQFLISERKLQTLFTDAVHWYAGSNASEHVYFVQNGEGQPLPADVLEFTLPDELLVMSKLASVTKRWDADQRDEHDPHTKAGWVLVLGILIAMVWSLC